MRKEKDIDIYDEQMAKGGTLESKFEGYDSMYNYALANNFTPRQLAEELRFMTNLQNEGDKELYDFLNNLSNMFPDTPVSEFKKGGMMQGYNDRLDESLGMREGREDMMMQSYKDRRNESKGMEKAMGRRAYQSVGTMDKMGMGGYLLAGGTGAYLGAKYPNKVKKVTDPLDKAVEDINRNLKNRYEDGGLVVGGSTVVRNNGDIMPLGTANADAVFQTGGVTAQTVVNPNEAMADLTSTYGFDDVYAKGGRTARGKSGRYHILGESPSAKQPFFYASTDDRASIKSLVSDAKKVFKDLGAKNVEVFVTDQKEDRRIYKNQYAKGGVAEGYSKFRVVFYNYSGETEEKEFDNYSDAG